MKYEKLFRNWEKGKKQQRLFEFKGLQLTRKYPLCGYILGVLTHITALDRHCGSDETLKCVLIYEAWLRLAEYCNVSNLAFPRLMGLREAKKAYFSIFPHTKQLLLVTSFYTAAGIGSVMGRDGTDKRMDRREG